jgi:type IV pilus assembly protein PilM
LRIDALEMGGLNAKVVDIEAYAIERAYALLKEQMGLDEHKIVAIIDIGATLITFYILNDGLSVYSREQLFGGNQLVERVRNLYGYSTKEAEIAIKDGTLPDGYETDVLNPFKEEITENVSRALQFFFSSSQYNDVDLIILAGGVAAIDGLDELVQDSLSTSTIVADPFADMLVDSRVNQDALRKDSSSLMLACGLAMRGLK